MDKLTNLAQALAEIEREATTGDSIIQPGAAFALAALAEAGGVGPGWTTEDLAHSLIATHGEREELIRLLIDQARDGDQASATLAQVRALLDSCLLYTSPSPRD